MVNQSLYKKVSAVLATITHVCSKEYEMWRKPSNSKPLS